MPRIFHPTASAIRLLGLSAVTALILSAGAAQRAEALTPINPAMSPAAKVATEDMVTQVRHGGGGFHGGGRFHGGGFHGGGFRASHFGGFHGGWHRHWGYRPYVHRRVYYGGYYPYYSYPRFHRCRIVWTHWGPRRICRWHHWHRWGWRHRHYW